MMRAAALWALGVWLGAAIARAQPSVALEVATDRKFYRERAASDVFVQARVVMAPAVEQGAAGGSVRNLALVLDRSGSMAEERMGALRAAVVAAVGKLAPEDVVSIVAFGSEVDTVIEARPRDQVRDLEEKMERIEPVGGAAVYDAINQGAAQVRRHATAATFNQIILVTDGPPTKGPREFEDFTKLAEALAREGIGLSTIGLGPEFNEDMLAAMAQAGQGRFRYCARPAELAGALVAEVERRPTVVGHDAVLSVTFQRYSRKLRAYDWHRAAIEGTAVAYSFPRLLRETPVTVLVAAELDAYSARMDVRDFATVRLRWKDAASGAPCELTQVVELQLTPDARDVRETANAEVVRAMVDATVREGLQNAIEQLDKANPRAAGRALRTARTEARDLNFDLEDRRIEERIRMFDAYLAEVQGRTLGAADRKFLRSGLGERFDPPSKVVEGKE